MDLLYPNTYDREQLYDLYADPSQKVNVATDHRYKHVVSRFEEMMRDYVDSICISETGVCFKPDAVRAVALVVAAGSRRKSSSWR